MPSYCFPSSYIFTHILKESETLILLVGVPILCFFPPFSFCSLHFEEILMYFCGRFSYCMRVQMDALPEGDWFCETCQMKQRHGGPKSLERLIAPSKSICRSDSLNSRPKPVSIQGNSRSRLSDRLNHKKPRLTSVRKSPSKAPIVQMPVKRLASDSLISPVSRKLPSESFPWATSSTISPPPMPQAPTPSAKPSLTRETTLKSAPDTGKVKFLAPSAVANFSSGARANAAKAVIVTSQPPKAGTRYHNLQLSNSYSLRILRQYLCPLT